MPAVCRSALHASSGLNSPALHTSLYDIQKCTDSMPASLLPINKSKYSPSRLCRSACSACLLRAGRNETLYQSALQVVHHTSHTHGLLTNGGVAVFVEASTVTASAFLFKLVAYMLLHIAARLPPALSIRADTATQLIAGSFCAFSWSTGQFTVYLTCPAIPRIGSCLQSVCTQCDAYVGPLLGFHLLCIFSNVYLQTCLCQRC